MPEVADIFGVKQRTVYRWRADGVTAERATSQMENFRHLLELLVMFDREDVARAAVEYFSSAINQDADVHDVAPLLPTIHEEELADYQKVAALHSAIEEGKPMPEIISLKIEAVEEIERTVAKYAKEKRNG